MAEEKGGSGKIIALLRRAELLLADSGTGRASPEELAGIARELARHRVELERQDEEPARGKNGWQKGHGELERRVAERTAELKSANSRLQQEIALCKTEEEELRSGERSFRQLVAMSPAGIWLTDKRGRCTYVQTT
ncbi:MAG: hypothetical protein M0P70_19105 [Desulfobulbaceae bacterium]|nr:hypothetical protein [Desulfobulbaceae bacterium]